MAGSSRALPAAATPEDDAAIDDPSRRTRVFSSPVEGYDDRGAGGATRE